LSGPGEKANADVAKANDMSISQFTLKFLLKYIKTEIASRLEDENRTKLNRKLRYF
jgi:hypothetical protein